MRDRRGFTLIELLVVIAIIAILAAILFPVFARARAKARQASCLSNMKQLALGMMMYTSDYDGMFPSVYDDGNGYPAGRIIWADKIYPYVKNRQIFMCPSLNLSIDPIPGRWPGSLQRTRYQCDMCDGQSSAYRGVFTEGWNSPVNEEQFQYPAETALITESDNAWWQHYAPNWNPGTNYDDSAGRVIVGWLNERTYPIHNGGVNAAYADGHAKWNNTHTIETNLRFWSRSGN